MSRPSGRTRRALVPACCWLVAAGALVLAPRLQALDPEGGIGAPAPPHLAWWLGLALVTVQCLALLLRHTAPTAVLLACAAAVPLAAVAGLGDATGVTSMAVLVAAYAVGTRRPIRGAWPALAAAVVVVAAGTALTGETVGVALAQGIGAIGMPLLVAAWTNGRREIREAREGQVQALAREHEARVQAAVADERTAMARELHDIAAHHLSGIAVMTAAIPGQIDTDPAGAKVAVRQVREQSTALLRDLRSLVGLLRDSATDTGAHSGADAHSDSDQPASTDAAGTRTRPETLAGIAPLVEELSHTGLDLQLAVLQRSPPLGSGIGPLAQLAAYRMVQESLANAARHAPGAARRVTVDDRDPRWLTLTVDNDPSTHRPDPRQASTGGFGLVGMQERADLTGARLRHGATPDGGWRVVLTVPRQEEIA